MKAIYPRKDTAVAMTNEDANHPAENLRDEHPTKVAKATGNTSQVEVTVAEGSSAIALFNTNALSAIVTVKNSDKSETLYGPTEYELTGVDTYYKLVTDSGVPWHELWSPYDYLTEEHKVLIDLEAGSGETLYAGVAFPGVEWTFTNPKLGLKEGRIDFTVIRRTNNDAIYKKKKHRVKTFRAVLNMQSAGDLYPFLRDLLDEIGPDPIPWKVTDQDSHVWTVYAMAGLSPVADYNNQRGALVNFTLEEVL